MEKEMRKEIPPFSKIFYPGNVAVFGVSPEEENLAKNIVLNSLTFGFKGEIFSIGLTGGVAFGQRIYGSLDEIDRVIDLAVILTPARTVPDVLEQCGKRGIKAAVVESGGFSELGEEGKPLEKACTEVAERHGMRFVGPNGIGVTNMENGLVLPFTVMRNDMCIGPVSILSQSGGVGISYVDFLVEERIGLNKFISMGNKLNIDENELLEYLIQDPGTRIILVYLEGFTDGRKFVEIASHSEKPILVHKSNRFRSSNQIARSHTAALSADDGLVDYALDQAGCVRVNTMKDAIQYIRSLTLPPLKGNRLAVVSRSGGHAVIAADACGLYGFQLPDFPEEMLDKINNHVRAGVIRLQNPLDVGDLFDLDVYTSIMEELLKSEDLDGVLLGFGYRKDSQLQRCRDLFSHVDRMVEKYQKPVTHFVVTDNTEKEYLRSHVRAPIFDAPEDAMRTFYLNRQWRSKRPLPFLETPPEGIDIQKAHGILDAAKPRGSLLLSESIELVKSYGFSAPIHALARTEKEAAEVFRSWNMPVAMKVNRPHISHKSEKGAVRLNLRSEAEVRSSFIDLRSIAGEDVEVLIQKMAAPGREIILGGKRDDCFGPVIMFGLGGIFTEVFRDVVWRLAPIRSEEAERMIQSIKGGPVLSGFRGEMPRDTEKLKDLLVRLSQMLVDFPRIQEIDINPVMVFARGEGAQAVDARVILAGC